MLTRSRDRSFLQHARYYNKNNTPIVADGYSSQAFDTKERNKTRWILTFFTIYHDEM